MAGSAPNRALPRHSRKHDDEPAFRENPITRLPRCASPQSPLLASQLRKGQHTPHTAPSFPLTPPSHIAPNLPVTPLLSSPRVRLAAASAAPTAVRLAANLSIL